MGAVHKMAPTGVCGALSYTCACWMYGWLFVAKKTHHGRATFCSFCLNTLRVILTDDFCVWRTWKINPKNELEQDLSICSRIDCEQCGTTYNTAEHLAWWHALRLLAASDACACVLFSTEKGVLAVLVCVCGYWLLSSSHRHLTSARS